MSRVYASIQAVEGRLGVVAVRHLVVLVSRHGDESVWCHAVHGDQLIDLGPVRWKGDRASTLVPAVDQDLVAPQTDLAHEITRQVTDVALKAATRGPRTRLATS